MHIKHFKSSLQVFRLQLRIYLLTKAVKCNIYLTLHHAMKFDVHESVDRDTIMKATNKMQLYRLIYYS
jgi:hypothetical protein